MDWPRARIAAVAAHGYRSNERFRPLHVGVTSESVVLIGTPRQREVGHHVVQVASFEIHNAAEAIVLEQKVPWGKVAVQEDDFRSP